MTDATPRSADRSRIPLLSSDALSRAEPVLAALLARLRGVGYPRLARAPAEHSRSAVLREPVNVVRFLRGRSHLLFHATAFPKPYRQIALPPSARASADAFFDGAPRSAAALESALGGALTGDLLDAGVLVDTEVGLLSRLRVTPVDDLLLLSDARGHRGSGDEPVWLGGDSCRLSIYLRGELAGRRFPRALDLCSGSGIQTFAAAAHADRAVGVDLNPRAVTIAELNGRLHGVANSGFRCGDLAADLGEPFDLIVSNPPFVAMPEAAREGNLDGYGGALGMDVTLRICDGLPDRLAPDGVAYLLTTSPLVRGRDLLVDHLRALSERSQCEVTLKPLRYAIPRAFADHLSATGIRHVTNYFVRIRRGPAAGLRRENMPPLTALMSRGRVEWQRRQATSAR